MCGKLCDGYLLCSGVVGRVGHGVVGSIQARGRSEAGTFGHGGEKNKSFRASEPNAACWICASPADLASDRASRPSGRAEAR